MQLVLVIIIGSRFGSLALFIIILYRAKVADPPRSRIYTYIRVCVCVYVIITLNSSLAVYQRRKVQ